MTKLQTQECYLCNTHISLVETIMNKCKCKNVFCFEHKIPENHKCSFNFRAAYATLLTSNIPLIQKKKLEQIL
jgi:predicted nucleic acid binding AN1-type Zn finger protein